MHIAIITAGGAGMFCGSCMQDNALARALMKQDCEVSLIPTYTPVRVDQESVTDKNVYLGGINLYLDQKVPFWKSLPRPLVSWLDHPRIIRWATSFGIENDGTKLGPMTLSMLRGEQGPMKREYDVFINHLVELKPDAILFSNVLLSGVIPVLREKLEKPILCLLQGDDYFLDQLPAQTRMESLALIRENCAGVDRFLTHTRFYAQYMSDFLDVALDRFHQIPLSLDIDDQEPFAGVTTTESDHPPRLGYFARIAPEKGLLELVRAAVTLQERGVDFELLAGGYLGPQYQKYFDLVCQEAAPLGSRFQYVGSPRTQQEKMDFLRSLSVFSVPANFHEPKGLYILEANYAGIPVVQPDHACFPELLESTLGGLLYPLQDKEQHANQLQALLFQPDDCQRIGEAAAARVREAHLSSHAAKALIDSVKSIPP